MARPVPHFEHTGVLQPTLDRYVNDLLPRRDPVLREMEQLAKREDIPIIGPACGRLLALAVQLGGAKRIFEMGSAIGYSALWMARAAGSGAKIHYTDSDPLNVERARAFLRRAGVLNRVTLLEGDALDLLRKTTGTFDLIFIDVDKDQYPAALRLALKRVRRGGLLVADNVLWYGRVARPAKRGDSFTRGVRQFNRMIYADKRLFPVIVPLRDGVAICRKG
ncbi:MAG TPA: O-methyltransferase [Candidatus Dormibacteraeota bacterium]|nr:O-methyltransferase [Candidatus Dormibacteraeota bacterium]